MNQKLAILDVSFVSQLQKNRNGGWSSSVPMILLGSTSSTQEFIDLDESVWWSVRLFNITKCLIGVIYRKSTVDTKFDNHTGCIFLFNSSQIHSYPDSMRFQSSYSQLL